MDYNGSLKGHSFYLNSLEGYILNKKGIEKRKEVFTQSGQMIITTALKCVRFNLLQARNPGNEVKTISKVGCAGYLSSTGI